MHTFPAYDEARRTWIESTCGRCPATAAILRRLPNIRTALFSRLGGGSRISGHRGWADLANHVLRCHLPLKVPSDGPCGLWVNEEVRACVPEGGSFVMFCARVRAPCVCCVLHSPRRLVMWVVINPECVSVFSFVVFDFPSLPSFPIIWELCRNRKEFF